MPTNHFTVTQIILAAAHRADMMYYASGTGASTLSGQIDQTACILQLNLECATLWDACVSAWDDYCLRHVNFAVRADQESYILPEDFYKFRAVFPIVNGTRGAKLKKFQFKDLGYADSYAPVMTSQIEESTYRVAGNRLWIHPTPTSAATLEMWYTPQFTPIIGLQDKLDFRFPNGWEEYVIEGLAAWMLEKEESDSSMQRARQQAALGRILTMAEDRDAGEPFQMIDAEDQLG